MLSALKFCFVYPFYYNPKEKYHNIRRKKIKILDEK